MNTPLLLVVLALPLAGCAEPRSTANVALQAAPAVATGAEGCGPRPVAPQGALGGLLPVPSSTNLEYQHRRVLHALCEHGDPTYPAALAATIHGGEPVGNSDAITSVQARVRVLQDARDQRAFGEMTRGNQDFGNAMEAAGLPR